MAKFDSSKIITSRKRREEKYCVLVTGMFGVGRRTLTNCLIGKRVLNTSIVPEVEFPVEVCYGTDDGMAKVHWKDLSRPEMVVPLKMLNQMVRMDPESDLHISRDDISYISLTANMEEHRISYLTQYYYTYGIDGLDYDSSNRRMLEGMDAVVVVMSALRFVTEFEREFIESNFARRGLKNVFFAINWANKLKEDDFQALHDMARKVLADVFTNADGYFDEDLYKRRVFFVDAYTSMCARTGGSKLGKMGPKFINYAVPPEEDEFTGVPELELALKRYLGL